MQTTLDVLRAKHARLDAARAYNLGQRTVILVSNANNVGEASYEQGAMRIQAAERLSLELPQRSGAPFGSFDVVRNATTEHLRNAVGDRRVENILLLGHAAYGLWRGSDDDIDWRQLGEAVGDHLKTGVFANLGCGFADTAPKVPLGNYVVGGEGLLLGKSDSPSTIQEAAQLTGYEILPRV